MLHALDTSNGLLDLGYTTRQAAFLALVTAYGGYFLRRQYTSFLGKTDGALTTTFLHKLLRLSHATCGPYRRRARLYHVNGRVVYAAGGHRESRNRRRVPFERAVEKVMLLDFVLRHRTERVLVAEADRLAFFEAYTHVTDADLAALVLTHTTASGAIERRLIDQTPVVLTDNDLWPGFLYIQGPTRSPYDFDAFLDRHDRLFRRLGQLRIIFCTAWPYTVRQAQRVLRGNPEMRRPGVGRRITTTTVLTHFEERHRFQQRQFASFSESDRERLRVDLERFRGDEYEEIYRRWTDKSASEDEIRTLLADAIRGYRLELVPEVLPFEYPATARSRSTRDDARNAPRDSG